MLTKCFGIISYLPEDENFRKIRKERLIKLISDLNTYFKLPIIILAQNWTEDDLNLIYDNNIYVYNYDRGLGVTRARIYLRDKLLKHNFDAYIFLDDDSELVTDKVGVNNYLKEIDNHPNMVGKFKGTYMRFLYISNYMLKIMDLDFIKNYESIRGEIWEDFAYLKTYERLYPSKFFTFSKRGIDEISQTSQRDEYSTWYKSEFGNEQNIMRNTKNIINKWYRSKRK